MLVTSLPHYHMLFPKRSTKKGFTLFELLISITIFVLLTALLLVKNSQFRGTTIMTNLAYDLALTVRQAQSYGINVQNTQNFGNQSATGAYSHAYGIHYDYNATPTQANPSQFNIYADINDNLNYDPGAGSDLLVQTNAIPIEYSVLKVCAVQKSDGITTYCTGQYGTGLNQALNNIDISFRRPEPDAKIYVNCATNPSCAQTPMMSASIFLTSIQGEVREVYVTDTGQISVIEDQNQFK